MSPALLRWRLAWYGLRLGTEHPRVRAMFGRYVASRGGRLTLASAGPAAFLAWCRAIGAAGFHNRGIRRHIGALPQLANPSAPSPRSPGHPGP